jgi:glutathione S-transferase
MIPVLFYLPGSCSFGSIVALAWLGQPFRLCRLDHVTIKSDAYRMFNTLRQVPTLKSDAGVLTESAAILNHLGFLGLDKNLAFKQGTWEFDRTNQMLSFLTTSLHGAMGPIVHPERFAESTSAQEELEQRAMKIQVPELLSYLEGILNRHLWLGGDYPNVADAYFYGIGRSAAKFIDFDRDFPNVGNYFTQFKLDPGVVFATAVEDQRITESVTGFEGEVSLQELS